MLIDQWVNYDASHQILQQIRSQRLQVRDVVVRSVSNNSASEARGSDSAAKNTRETDKTNELTKHYCSRIVQLEWRVMGQWRRGCVSQEARVNARICGKNYGVAWWFDETSSVDEVGDCVFASMPQTRACAFFGCSRPFLKKFRVHLDFYRSESWLTPMKISTNEVLIKVCSVRTRGIHVL